MTSRIPEELRMSRNDHIRVRQSSRWAVELEKMENHVSGMNYLLKGTEEGIRAIEFTVYVDLESTKQSNISEVRLRLIVHEGYPNTLPRVYPIDMKIPFDHNAHVYRDKKNQPHLCMIKQEEWTEDCTLSGMMILSSLWVHKYLVWRNTGIWPGHGRPHCVDCGRIICEC
jgi:hypothetical protein